ncbi:MAG: hypothetical protein IT495_14075 [Gammaproteobacteria bacterium]|nr:hypothetical protein [Gammaproteobacteria bacterium]
MRRWELIDTAVIPGEGGELRLLRRGDDFCLRTSRHGELMNSRSHGSEDALGELACAGLAPRPGVSVLIGGLGMGFTLAAALARLAPDATVTVAELVPEVVRWNEGPLAACAGQPLRDARVRLHHGDVGALLRRAREAYDAVLLDVDNGPEGMTRRANDRLYSLTGLADIQRALKAGGTLAVWSAAAAADFTARLRKIGFTVDERRVRAHGHKGSRHVIWLATV